MTSNSPADEINMQTERTRAETDKLIAEAKKLEAEARKMMAEQHRSALEALTTRGWGLMAGQMVVAAILAAMLIAIGALLAKVFF